MTIYKFLFPSNGKAFLNCYAFEPLCARVSKAQIQTRFKSGVFSGAGSAKTGKNPCPLFVINYTINERKCQIFFEFFRRLKENSPS